MYSEAVSKLWDQNWWFPLGHYGWAWRHLCPSLIKIIEIIQIKYTHCNLRPHYYSPMAVSSHCSHGDKWRGDDCEKQAGLMRSREQKLSCVETCHHPLKTAIIIHGGICSLLPPAERGRMMSHLVTQQNHLECFPCFAVAWRGLGTTVTRNQRWQMCRQAIMSDIKLCVGLHGLKMCVCADKHWLFWNVPEKAISWTLQATLKVVKWSTASLRAHYLMAACGPWTEK